MNRLPPLPDIERELRKRLPYPYHWGRRQNNYYNGCTNFIYHVSLFEELLKQIDAGFKNKPDYTDFQNYALNRWYNFWSARAVESIFASLPDVIPSADCKDTRVDFSIRGVRFDHKTTVFPREYPGGLAAARNNPGDLIEWLYEHQSQEHRRHLANRLFIVLHAHDGEHWKLKAEIGWLKSLIERYVKEFNPGRLLRFSLEPDSITLADIIWGVQERQTSEMDPGIVG